MIKNTSVHAGIRAPLISKGDKPNDVRCGFDLITARAIDKIGADGIIAQIKERVGQSNVYISVDIDVLDPAYAPGNDRSNPFPSLLPPPRLWHQEVLIFVCVSSNRHGRAGGLDEP